MGIEPGTLVSIYLVTGKDTMTYSAPVEFVHAALARKHARENPSGKKRRTFSKAVTGEERQAERAREEARLANDDQP